jgi:lysophospholipase L1-like esterase
MNLLALGDSIMWGQGNADATKFVSLVTKWLDDAATPTLLAHSGAISAPTQRDSSPPLWGEVPEASPSILAQCATTNIQSDAVDVVLVNGGINDVSAFHIVVADPFDPSGVAKIQQRTREVFTGSVARLLIETATRFTKAKIVVLGYYPIVSAQSNARELAKLLKHLPRPFGVPNTIDWVIEHMTDGMIEVAIEVEKKRMVEQCAAFHAQAEAILKMLVADRRDKFGPRVAYATPNFGPENAYAAPETWLWSGSDDPLHDRRVMRYAEQAAIDPFAWPLYTPVASMCHPNEAGARAYAKAITAALQALGSTRN